MTLDTEDNYSRGYTLELIKESPKKQNFPYKSSAHYM